MITLSFQHLGLRVLGMALRPSHEVNKDHQLYVWIWNDSKPKDVQS
jgi:hypothetical protein